MEKSCAACEAQLTKGPNDPAHPELKLVFKRTDHETQFLCMGCGEMIFHDPDKTPAWRTGLF